MALRPDLAKQYGRAGGPLPERGRGAFATWFWRAYDRGDTGIGIDRPAAGTLAAEAFKAGLRRRRVQPGLPVPGADETDTR